MALTLYPFFKGSFMDLKRMPFLEKELIVLGKSNAGKSTLINSLLNRDICHTSKTPGRTTALNVITIDKGGLKAIVDVPGYGFAKSAASMRQQWATLLPEYLAMPRPNPRRAWVLMPAYNPFSATDQEVIEMLVSSGIQTRIIITKIDKIKPPELQKKQEEIQKIFQLFQGVSILSFSKHAPLQIRNIVKKDMEEYFSN